MVSVLLLSSSRNEQRNQAGAFLTPQQFVVTPSSRNSVQSSSFQQPQELHAVPQHGDFVGFLWNGDICVGQVQNPEYGNEILQIVPCREVQPGGYFAPFPMGNELMQERDMTQVSPLQGGSLDVYSQSYRIPLDDFGVPKPKADTTYNWYAEESVNGSQQQQQRQEPVSVFSQYQVYDPSETAAATQEQQERNINQRNAQSATNSFFVDDKKPIQPPWQQNSRNAQEEQQSRQSDRPASVNAPRKSQAYVYDPSADPNRVDEATRNRQSPYTNTFNNGASSTTTSSANRVRSSASIFNNGTGQASKKKYEVYDPSKNNQFSTSRTQDESTSFRSTRYETFNGQNINGAGSAASPPAASTTTTQSRPVPRSAPAPRPPAERRRENIYSATSTSDDSSSSPKVPAPSRSAPRSAPAPRPPAQRRVENIYAPVNAASSKPSPPPRPSPQVYQPPAATPDTRRATSTSSYYQASNQNTAPRRPPAAPPEVYDPSKYQHNDQNNSNYQQGASNREGRRLYNAANNINNNNNGQAKRRAQVYEPQPQQRPPDQARQSRQSSQRTVYDPLQDLQQYVDGRPVDNKTKAKSDVKKNGQTVDSRRSVSSNEASGSASSSSRTSSFFNGFPAPTPAPDRKAAPRPEVYDPSKFSKPPPPPPEYTPAQPPPRPQPQYYSPPAPAPAPEPRKNQSVFSQYQAPPPAPTPETQPATSNGYTTSNGYSSNNGYSNGYSNNGYSNGYSNGQQQQRSAPAPSPQVYDPSTTASPYNGYQQQTTQERAGTRTFFTNGYASTSSSSRQRAERYDPYNDPYRNGANNGNPRPGGSGRYPNPNGYGDPYRPPPDMFNNMGGPQVYDPSVDPYRAQERTARATVTPNGGSYGGTRQDLQDPYQKQAAAAAGFYQQQAPPGPQVYDPTEDPYREPQQTAAPIFSRYPRPTSPVEAPPAPAPQRERYNIPVQEPDTNIPPPPTAAPQRQTYSIFDRYPAQTQSPDPKQQEPPRYEVYEPSKKHDIDEKELFQGREVADGANPFYSKVDPSTGAHKKRDKQYYQVYEPQPSKNHVSEEDLFEQYSARSGGSRTANPNPTEPASGSSGSGRQYSRGVQPDQGFDFRTSNKKVDPTVRPNANSYHSHVYSQGDEAKTKAELHRLGELKDGADSTKEIDDSLPVYEMDGEVEIFDTFQGRTVLLRDLYQRTAEAVEDLRNNANSTVLDELFEFVKDPPAMAGLKPRIVDAAVYDETTGTFVANASEEKDPEELLAMLLEMARQKKERERNS